jgi:hypothetical protein
MNVLERIQNFFLESGIWLHRATDAQKVHDLIRRLRPVPTSSELIRIGPNADGGYLLPNDLAGISGCISPGVSTECGFDLQIAQRGIPVLMLDGSVKGSPVQHPLFKFLPLFLDAYLSETTTTLDAVASTFQGDMLLQMDIEGAEYRVLSAASSAVLNRFRVMIIEFHHLEQIFCPLGLKTIVPCFDKLLRTHAIVHAHQNNVSKIAKRDGAEVPGLMEFTFHRLDRLGQNPGPGSIQIRWMRQTFRAGLIALSRHVGCRCHKSLFIFQSKQPTFRS